MTVTGAELGLRKGPNGRAGARPVAVMDEA